MRAADAANAAEHQGLAEVLRGVVSCHPAMAGSSRGSPTAFPPKTLAALADEWAPRLGGLRGIGVVALHARRGVDSDVTVRLSDDASTNAARASLHDARLG